MKALTTEVVTISENESESEKKYMNMSIKTIQSNFSLQLKIFFIGIICSINKNLYTFPYSFLFC